MYGTNYVLGNDLMAFIEHGWQFPLHYNNLIMYLEMIWWHFQISYSCYFVHFNVLLDEARMEWMSDEKNVGFK